MTSPTTLSLKLGPALHATARPGRMTQTDVVNMLADLVPFLNQSGKDLHLEAVCEAIERLRWSDMGSAPRDGTTIIIAFSGRAPSPPYSAYARWIAPAAGAFLEARERKLVARHGGWWGSGRGDNAHRCRAMAWMPAPELPDMGLTPEPGNQNALDQECAA